MKKITVFFFLIISFQCAFAQTSKGSFLVGGNVYASFSKTDTKTEVIKYTSFSIAPRVGFFALDNFCVGLMTPLSFATSKTISPSFEDLKSRSTSVGAGPFLRYYFPLNKFCVITELGYAFNRVEYKDHYFDVMSGQMVDGESKTTTKEFQSAAGLGLTISDHVMLEFLLNYRNLDYDYEGSSGYSQTYKGNNIYLSIGLQVYIPKS